MKKISLLGLLMVGIGLIGCVGDDNNPQQMEAGPYQMGFSNGLVSATTANSGTSCNSGESSDSVIMDVESGGVGRLYINSPVSNPTISKGAFTNPINNGSTCFTGTLKQSTQYPLQCNAITDTSTLVFKNCTTVKTGNFWTFRANYFVYSINSSGNQYPVLQGTVVGNGG